MPSFDIVSVIDKGEVKNAIDQAQREVSTRYDFKGSNTTLERPFKGYGENLKGGLSGELLYQVSTNQLKRVYEYTKGQIPLIGVGGISSAKDAYNKIRNGASLVQLYTGIVYHGPGLIKKMNSEISALLKNDGFDSISDAVGVDAEIKNGT